MLRRKFYDWRKARSVAALLRRVKLWAYDFDGVMTDNTALVDQTGRESVRVNRSDGLAVYRLKAQGIAQIIVSTEENSVVQSRGRKLDIPVISGCQNKLEAVQKVCEEMNIQLKDVLFIGNDQNDLALLRQVGVKVCPADAYPAILKEVDYVCRANGGEGVIRELFELLQVTE